MFCLFLYLDMILLNYSSSCLGEIQALVGLQHCGATSMYRQVLHPNEKRYMCMVGYGQCL